MRKIDSIPKVTICIPCYNEPENILRAITSVLNQTYSNIEVIISDCGSDEYTLNILSKIEINDNLRILYNKGISKFENWHSVIQASKGDYIMIMHARHYIYSNAISDLVKPFIKFSSENIAYVRGCMVYELSDGTKSNYIPAEFSRLINGTNELKLLLKGNTCEIITTLYDAHKLKESLPFDTNLERTFVWFQNAKLASKWPVYFVNSDIGEWTISESNEDINVKTKKANSELPALFEKLFKICSDIGLEIERKNYSSLFSLNLSSHSNYSLTRIFLFSFKKKIPKFFLICASESFYFSKNFLFRIFPILLSR
jgi:glycosyltransferase involved in cell wall biosynthesis